MNLVPLFIPPGGGGKITLSYYTQTKYLRDFSPLPGEMPRSGRGVLLPKQNL
jgi:hypothetical protein